MRRLFSRDRFGVTKANQHSKSFLLATFASIGGAMSAAAFASSWPKRLRRLSGKWLSASPARIRRGRFS